MLFAVNAYEECGLWDSKGDQVGLLSAVATAGLSHQGAC